MFRAVLALVSLSPLLAGEPPKADLRWQKSTASPFARVESPTAVIDGKMYLFGGFTDQLGASNRVDVYQQV